MISKLQASAKLYLLVFVMSIFVIGIGVYGIQEMKAMNQNIKTLYADRVFPLQQLTTIRFAYAVGILSLSEQVQTSQLTFKEAIKKVQGSEKSITSNWKSYMLTYLTPEEKQLAEQASALMDHSAIVVEKLKTVMNKEDAHELDNLVKNELYPALNPVVAKLSELIDLQVRVSEEILKNSNKVYNNSLKKSILLIVLSLIIAMPILFYLVKSVKDLIQNLQISNKKIAESERKSRALIENAGDAIFMVNEDTFITDVNDYACRLLGYSREELLRMKISEIVPPEELKKQVLYIESINKNINSLSERRLKRKDGQEVDTEINTRLLKGVGYISIIRDNTERKLAENALRKSKEHLRLVIDTIPALVWSALPDGSLDFINQRHLEFTGHTLEDLKNWRWADLFHPDDRTRVIEEWRKTLASGKQLKTEGRFKRAFGDYHWFLFQAVPLHDESGDIVGWYGTSTDITELKETEDALRKSEDSIRLIIDTIPIMAWSISADGIPDFVNKQWQDYTGISLEEEKKNPNQPIHPEDLPRILKNWEEGFAAGKTIEDEMRIQRADGEYRWFLVRIDPLHDDKGNVIKWYGVAIDIDDSKRANEALQKSYEEIRRLTEHLQKIREEERIHIAREIHDELGQQLTAVKMDVAWIDKKTSEEMIDIKRKLKNIRQLLDGSNLSIRRILSELRPRVLDDHSLLEAIQWLSGKFAETTGIPIKFTTTEKDLKVPEQISTCIFRVCQEAFTNIIRHSHAKNISTSIKVIEENITLAIEDDGVGFDAISEQNKKTFGILGMKERVLFLGGKFKLVSSPGNGTKITVSLPYNT